MAKNQESIENLFRSLDKQEPNVVITIKVQDYSLQALMGLSDEEIKIYQLRSGIYVVSGPLGVDICSFTEMMAVLTQLFTDLNDYKYSVDAQFEEESEESNAILSLINLVA